MSASTATKYEQTIPDVLQTMASVHQVLDTKGLDLKIRHLVQLRASQINRCGFCIKMHTKEARQNGETGERLDRVIVWDQVNDFSDAEKAALAWTEALTSLQLDADLASIRARLSQHYSNAEIGTLTAEVAMINLWNRINVSKH
ncbi:carboxymuconolactone decarboxylase family protein [uncultured Roseobacter sp.]|uniref:carboxymuconolactone decarboxylase family protein n=1 Tax=uncultured Roseobacter sp. TaxID=114847 RepID=UPI00262E9C15|nr:carboxymuconolactone decarboxylase family protein [uncultured Roseobacter sp.]